jgi:lipid A 3-O-deacylase
VNEYGISLTIDAFTPVDIKQKEIMENDRPYAGYIMAGHFVISTQAAKSRRLVSRLNLGIIGPESQTKDIQKGLHALLQCAQPQGWNNQIKRDIIIDYSLQLEKALFPLTKNIEMIAQGNVRVGTLYNNIGLGGKIRIGKMNGYFTSFPPSMAPGKPLYLTQKVRLFGYVQINTKLNAYNATLQGGVFNKESPHVLEQQQVERAVMEWKSGLVCGYENISIEIGQTNLTREFKAGERHSWGYVTLTILL